MLVIILFIVLGVSYITPIPIDIGVGSDVSKRESYVFEEPNGNRNTGRRERFGPAPGTLDKEESNEEVTGLESVMGETSNTTNKYVYQKQSYPLYYYEIGRWCSYPGRLYYISETRVCLCKQTGILSIKYGIGIPKQAISDECYTEIQIQ